MCTQLEVSKGGVAVTTNSQNERFYKHHRIQTIVIQCCAQFKQRAVPRGGLHRPIAAVTATGYQSRHSAHMHTHRIRNWNIGLAQKES